MTSTTSLPVQDHLPTWLEQAAQQLQSNFEQARLQRTSSREHRKSARLLLRAVWSWTHSPEPNLEQGLDLLRQLESHPLCHPALSLPHIAPERYERLWPIQLRCVFTDPITTQPATQRDQFCHALEQRYETLWQHLESRRNAAIAPPANARPAPQPAVDFTVVQKKGRT